MVRRPSCDVALFHEFMPPPTGGGHQFLRALWRELNDRGYTLENNRISHGTQVCLFNSFNFDFKRLKRHHRRHSCRMVHRVDGPIGVYRGFDDGTDERIHHINLELADATVFQSTFSYQKHVEMGMTFAAPVVIGNAVAPAIFHADEKEPFCTNRRIRLISVSWSDNPNKGAGIYRRLDEILDWNRFEYAYAGRVKEPFRNISPMGSLTSQQVAGELRRSDIYITASRNDPCSNSLLEALACGLPCLHLNSGGHPEIVGRGGLPFEDAEEIPALLNRLIDNYGFYRSAISVPTIAEIANRYIDVLFGGDTGASGKGEKS